MFEMDKPRYDWADVFVFFLWYSGQISAVSHLHGDCVAVF